MLVFDSPHAFLSFGSERIGLDAKAETTFISHAHLDHYVSALKSKTVLSSQATLDLLKARKKKVPDNPLESHQNGVKLTLHNAGHVLGSRMLHAQGDQSVVYTGDFLSEDSITQKAAKPISCDMLIVECTYGLPQYRFPSRWGVYEQIGTWAKKVQDSGQNAVIGAYSVGKAQEVTKALNHSGVVPAVSANIAQIHSVYEKHDIALDYVNADTPEGQEVLSKPFVAVAPMHQVNECFKENLKTGYGRKVRTAVATGWAQDLRGSTNQAFCLSDHNDFPALVSFIQNCNPKKVYTTHGPAEVFAAHLCREGLDAQPLEALGEKQKTLEAF
ncbi:MAG TPA: hypothetical protein VI874_05700 [Candidatus Norongarragalinales archaeon]|nr:hypothetical protein [Candidatus Norongarragalinales archaeon]